MTKQTGSACDWSRGQEPGPATLYSELYEELRRIAASHMRKQGPGHDLRTTDLLGEAYVKLAGMRRGRWRTRNHFLAEAAKTMRSVLVDHARFLGRIKRLPPGRRVALDGIVHSFDRHRIDVLTLDEALDSLASQGAKGTELARIAELVLFGGMSCPEIANVLGLSLRTVERRWRKARAFLRHRLS